MCTKWVKGKTRPVYRKDQWRVMAKGIKRLMNETSDSVEKKRLGNLLKIFNDFAERNDVLPGLFKLGQSAIPD
jgi:hypothetical protein